jgi:putative ATPase
MSDLFSHRSQKDRRGQPLAERMRPRNLDEYLGQRHLLGEGHLLASALQSRSLPSLILWGPPGSGKTTLARLLAAAAGARFSPMSAVMSGIKDLRELVAEAGERRDVYGEATVLFLDEIHRFNKAQQDALLPHVEAGTVTLIGATTENPSFEVIAALLSRTKVVRLEPLTDEELETLLRRALQDTERGLGKLKLEVPAEVITAIAGGSGGDARRALTTLEVAATLARPGAAGGPRSLQLETVREAEQKRTLLYDKGGEEHYNVISAFIKSLRGSDPDAAVYWMARMLEAGEDPLFVCRRMVIFAAEDVGLADPRALQVATAAFQATQVIGLPEAVLPMTESALYLALAPKSNTALTTYANARKLVNERGALPVPLHIRNAHTPLMKQMDYGKGYKYPHEFSGHYVVERYLPEAIASTRLYIGSQSGEEKPLWERLQRLRAEASGSPDSES